MNTNKNISLSIFMVLAMSTQLHGSNTVGSSMDEELITYAQQINAAAIKNMLAMGADANYQDYKSNTPLHYLTQAIIDRYSTVTIEFEYLQAKRYLLCAGANYNIPNRNGITAQDILSGTKNIDSNQVGQRIRGKRNARWW